MQAAVQPLDWTAAFMYDDRVCSRLIVQNGSFMMPVYSCRTIDSTNAHAIRLIEGGAGGDEFAVTAAEQTAGRGRMERVWVSKPGLGLYLSIVSRPCVAVENLPQSTLVAAVAAVHALRARCDAPVSIKWPNDLYYDGKKLGGILTQTKWGAPGARVSVVVGIGINCNHVVDDFPPELRTTATSMRAITGVPIDGEILVPALLDSFQCWRRCWEEDGFAVVRREWLSLDCTVGKRVSLPEHPDRKAVVTGISEYGELVLKDDSGEEHTVIAGDVVL